VLEAGETVTALPVKAPGFQVYVVAPLPVKVAEAPEQIAVDDAEAVTVGVTLTVNNTVPVLVHPTEFVPEAE
jgi:hypothetical protein